MDDMGSMGDRPTKPGWVLAAGSSDARAETKVAERTTSVPPILPLHLDTSKDDSIGGCELPVGRPDVYCVVAGEKGACRGVALCSPELRPRVHSDLVRCC